MSKSICTLCADEYCPGKRNFNQIAHCIEFRPVTHFDEIKAMSVEKLEAWYWWMHKEMMKYTDSRVFVHDWLKSPAEVDE